MVTPRLSALARLPRVADEISERARAEGVALEWLRRPAVLGGWPELAER